MGNEIYLLRLFFFWARMALGMARRFDVETLIGVLKYAGEGARDANALVCADCTAELIRSATASA
jgi:hypothetical protein